MEWTKEKASDAYNSSTPWLEDQYLSLWGENKTSYTAKNELGSRALLEKLPASMLPCKAWASCRTVWLREWEANLERRVKLYCSTVSVPVEKGDSADDFAGRSARRCRRGVVHATEVHRINIRLSMGMT